ncbi:MAG: PDZ domain-containing protein [Acidimicrobiia bacterium]|nr:PDZ domain-containing protein [Acidimicrobiia bacterium]
MFGSVSGAISAVLAIIIFVTIHELGHFGAARIVGMKTTQFFFGFGPKLWSTTRGETEYGVKLLPLGGHVTIAGMNPYEEIEPEDRGRTYADKKYWQKSFVVIAGVASNFLLAFLMLAGVNLIAGVPQAASEVPPVVSELVGDPAPAAIGGMETGDLVISIDGVPIGSVQELGDVVRARPGENVEVTWERDGEPMSGQVPLETIENPETGETFGRIGIASETLRDDVGIFSALGLAGGQIVTLTGETFQAIWQLVSPESLLELAGVFVGDTDVPIESRPISPIGLANVGSQLEALGIANFLRLLAMVNVFLGSFNIVPLYPLDGGHFAVATYEKITGRQADLNKMVPIAVAVVALFVFIGLVAVILDIVDPLQL